MDTLMTLFITFLPDIFCYATGILVVWSGLIAYSFANFASYLISKGRHPRKTDSFQFIAVVLIAVSLLLSLFVFTKWTTRTMDLILFLEFWYCLFLHHISVNFQLARTKIIKSYRKQKLSTESV